MTERRSRRGFSSTGPPDDPRRHATVLRERLQAARAAAATEDVGGYDERHLIKITLADKVQPEEVARAAGNVQVVSQEEGTLLLAFASDEQLAAFEARLTSLATGEHVSYRQVLYALQDLARWTPDDLMGWALKRDGFSDQEPFVVDAELLSLERGDEARRLRGAQSVSEGRTGREIARIGRKTGPQLGPEGSAAYRRRPHAAGASTPGCYAPSAGSQLTLERFRY